MGSMPDNSFIILIPFVLSLCLLLFLMYRAPYRLFNSYLLVLTLILALFALISLLSREASTLFLILSVLGTSFLLLLVPLPLVWNGVVMIKRESGKLANILSLLLGVMIGAGEIAFAVFLLNGTQLHTSVLVSALIALFGLSVLFFSLLLLAFVLYALILPRLRHKRRFDAVIVHGCALIRGDKVSRILADRLELALGLYRDSGERAMLIVSGGQGADETVSEAAAMKAYLVEHGVSAEQILLEDRSHSTLENLSLSKAILEAQHCDASIALVTSNYHLYRCVLSAKELGIRAVGFGARVAPYYWPSAVIREFAAVYSRKRYAVTTAVLYGLFVLLPVLSFLFYS